MDAAKSSEVAEAMVSIAPVCTVTDSAVAAAENKMRILFEVNEKIAFLDGRIYIKKYCPVCVYNAYRPANKKI